MSEDKNKLTNEEKIEKAKALLKEMKELELTEEEMKAASGGGKVGDTCQVCDRCDLNPQ